MSNCGECNAVDIGGKINHYHHCSQWDGVKGRSVKVSTAHAKTPEEMIEYLEEQLYIHAKKATRLRGLLVEIHEVVVGEPIQCPSCGVVGCRDDGFCKLAAEVGGECVVKPCEEHPQYLVAGQKDDGGNDD